MTEQKHTPGPWEVGEDPAGLHIIMEQLYGVDEYLAVYASPNPERRMADAHLIAAAPAMLAACQGIIREDDPTTATQDWQSPDDFIAWAIDQLTAALILAGVTP